MAVRIELASQVNNEAVQNAKDSRLPLWLDGRKLRATLISPLFVSAVGN